jgi:hypothetical protein
VSPARPRTRAGRHPDRRSGRPGPGATPAGPAGMGPNRGQSRRSGRPYRRGRSQRRCTLRCRRTDARNATVGSDDKATSSTRSPAQGWLPTIAGTSRAGLQPWPRETWIGLSRRCHLRTLGSSLRPCSRETNRPPGRSEPVRAFERNSKGSTLLRRVCGRRTAKMPHGGRRTPVSPEARGGTATRPQSIPMRTSIDQH